MKPKLYLISIFALAGSLQAAVPLKWTVETSRVQPAQFDAYHGETLDMEVTLLSYGSPLVLPPDSECRIFWQTNGMGNVYWSTNAVLVSTNSIAAVFRPTFDPGATTVLGFIGIPASNYRAAFTIRFRGSPGATPFNPPPMPQAEYYTKPEVDSRIGSATNAIRRVDGAVRPLPPYLHALDFDDAYPEDAAWYYAQPQDYGQCSSVRDGNSFARNYDWKFDRSSEFVVRMSAGPGRFASVGVANCGTNLTEEISTSGKRSRYIKCLPGRTVDGINENGVVANVNVVSGVPTWQTGDGLHPLAAVRWVLDNATSAASAAQHLAEHIRFPSGWTQNFHWMIADATETWIVENGGAHQVTGRAAMTNFPLYPTRGSGEGQERYDALMDGSNITSQWWTLTYTADGYRASDLPGIDSNLVFAAWASKPRESHRGETFGDVAWWQTVHTSIYDITNRTLRIAVQERDDWYVFAVPSAGGIKEETDPTVADWAKKPNPAPVTDLSPAITYTTAVSNKLETSKQAVIGDLATIRTGAAAGATAVQPGDDISFERQVFDPSTLSWACYNYLIGADGIRAGKQFGSGILLLETAWFNSDSIGFGDNNAKIYFPAVHSGTLARLEDLPTDSTVAGWGYLKQEEDPTVAGAVSAHDSSPSAHGDIRTALGVKLDKSWLVGDSIVAGAQVQTSGWHTVAIGPGATAHSNPNRTGQGGSTAVGENAMATGYSSTAIGTISTADGSGASALGGHSHANAPKSLASGWNATANGENSVAIGTGAFTEAGATGAIGISGRATARNAVQIGWGENPDENTLQFLDWKVAMRGDPVSVTSVTNSEGICLPELKSMSDSSPTGETWSQSNVTSGNFYDFAYANGEFVAVGDTGIYTSSDGKTWTCVNPQFTTVKRIAYGNGVYVGNSADGRFFYASSPAGPWNIPSGEVAGRFIIFGNGKFLTSQYNIIYTSTDGNTWTKASYNSSPDTIWFAGNYFFAKTSPVSSAGYLTYSTDGVTWTTCGGTPAYSAHSVVFDGEKYMSWNTSSLLHTSEDGIVWTRHELQPVRGVGYCRAAYANGNYLFTPDWDTAYIYASQDGYTAKATTRIPADTYTGFFSVNGICVMGEHNSGGIWYSAPSPTVVPLVQQITRNGEVLPADDDNRVEISEKKIYPLFIIDLNRPDYVSYSSVWTDIELKGSTNNFTSTSTPPDELVFWGASADNEASWSSVTHDWFRLFVSGSDYEPNKRKWVRITNTSDLMGFHPAQLAILICPTDTDSFRRGQGADWCREDNDELIWTYIRISDIGYEFNPATMGPQFREVMPVKWYSKIPKWAEQTPQ